MHVTTTSVSKILTRTSGFLESVSSHSLQPYRGCALGNSFCGVACYVNHNPWVTRGEAWGSFVEGRSNAADAYRADYQSEQTWARKARGRFGIFLSSSTEPFQPLERTMRITQQVLKAMIESPPDFLILQTHSHHVVDYLDLYPTLAERTKLRFHISIESDLDRLPELPPPASSVEKRISAAAALKDTGMTVVITVSPLLPMLQPHSFFQRLTKVADAVVIDHFIEGDGTRDGSRTLRTALPAAMKLVNPKSVTLEYRDEIVAIASEFFPGRVGVNIEGFAGRMLSSGKYGPGCAGS